MPVFRRTVKLFRVALLLLLIAAGTILSAQTRHEGITATSLGPITPVQALDFGQGQLPRKLVPVDAEGLYETASRALQISAKSEFETTSQYQNRIDALMQKPLFRGLRASDDFAFILKPASQSISGLIQKRDDFLTMDFLETKYDADSQEMKVEVPTYGGESGSDYKWVTGVHRTVAYGSPYVGQNAFGVKKLIRKINTSTTELEVENFSWISPDSSDEDLNKVFSISVDPGRARSLYNYIEVILVGPLTPPFTSNSNDGNEPSLDNLLNIRRAHHLLHISLDQLIIADSRTGEIIKLYSRQKHSTQYPLTVELRAVEMPFTDARCDQSAYSFPSNLVNVNYSVDGAAEKLGILTKPLHLEAQQFVDVSVPYCNIPRVDVLVNGKPRKLDCEYQDRYIGNNSKCHRIQVEP